MNFKHWFAAAILAFTGVASASVQPGYVGTLDNTAVEISNVVAPGAFTDYYLFNVSGSGTAGAAVISIPFPTSATFIDFTFLGFVDSSFHLLGADIDPSDGMGPVFVTLPSAGLYYLAVAGVAGPQGGIYDGFLGTAVVPEPEVVVLMLAGLMAATVARRRKRG